MYCTRIRPLLEYALPIWGGLPGYLGNELECIQKRSLAIIGVENSACKKLSIRQDVATERELVQILADVLHPCNKEVQHCFVHKYNLHKYNQTQIDHSSLWN